MIDPLDRIYERVLVLRCQAGDHAALAEIIERYQARLRLFLGRMLDDEHAADDALQEVWLDVFRNVGKLTDAGAFAGWVYRIARDRAYRILRRRRQLVLEPVDQPDPRDTSAEVAFDAAEQREMVQQSMNRLPHAQREVLLLRFVENLSYEQIASTIGCGVGTVRSRLHYAKLALREQLERNNLHARQ